MLQREASALRNKVGELHRTVNDLFGLLQGKRLCKPLNSQREHVDKRELTIRLVLADIYPPRSDTLPHILSGLVNRIIRHSKVALKRGGSDLLHKGRLAAAHRARYSNSRGSRKPAS